MTPLPLPFGRNGAIPFLMGIINVTPDSFSDGGHYLACNAAREHGIKLMEEGAGILDIGGESTRPGATPLPEEVECARVIPVFEALREDAKKRGVLLSVDTRKAGIMRAALKAGANIINDVTALAADPGSLAVAAETGATVILMHMRGTPETMQASPYYKDVVGDILSFFQSRINACHAAGIAKEKIVIDPGIGFGKTPQHNIQLLAHLSHFHALGVPLMIGASRKSFISTLTGECPPSERLGGSLAAALSAARAGVQIIRVHDVAATRQALLIQHHIDAVALPSQQG